MRGFLSVGTMALAMAIPGAGLAADRTYDLPLFTAIDISAGVDAVVTVGGSQSVAATAADDAILRELRVEVRDGTLKVWRDWDILDLFEIGPKDTSMTITAPSLTGAEASAGADVAVSGLTGERVLLEASSGADLKATDMQATTVEIDVSSGADLSANGTCTRVDIDVSSGARAEVDDLACTDAKVEASSGANVTLRASGSLRAEASSGADIRVRGKPANSRVEESSGGKVTIGD